MITITPHLHDDYDRDHYYFLAQELDDGRTKLELRKCQGPSRFTVKTKDKDYHFELPGCESVKASLILKSS